MVAGGYALFHQAFRAGTAKGRSRGFDVMQFLQLMLARRPDGGQPIPVCLLPGIFFIVSISRHFQDFSRFIAYRWFASIANLFLATREN